MEFETYIVLEKGTNLKRLKSGDGTYSYTVGGQCYFPVGKTIPVISLDENSCIGIATVEVVTIRKDSTTVYFKFIDNHNYSQIYAAWMLQSGSSESSANFGIPSGYRSTYRSYPKSTRDYDDDEDDDITTDDIDRIFNRLR